MSQPSNIQPDDSYEHGGCNEDRLRSIIAECEDIPAPVRGARFTRVDERVIDESLLRFLTEHCVPGLNDVAQAARTKRRAEALSPCLGKTLACVLIMLPGVRYTIEVDCCAGRVMHWEWQPG